jgi:hypothetical protein
MSATSVTALVVGPTGAGKSVLLALMVLQFRRYADSQIFAFDFGGSIRAALFTTDDAAVKHYAGAGRDGSPSITRMGVMSFRHGPSRTGP